LCDINHNFIRHLEIDFFNTVNQLNKNFLSIFDVKILFNNLKIDNFVQSFNSFLVDLFFKDDFSLVKHLN